MIAHPVVLLLAALVSLPVLHSLTRSTELQLKLQSSDQPVRSPGFARNVDALAKERLKRDAALAIVRNSQSFCNTKQYNASAGVLIARRERTNERLD